MIFPFLRGEKLAALRVQGNLFPLDPIKRKIARCRREMTGQNHSPDTETDFFQTQTSSHHLAAKQERLRKCRLILSVWLALDLFLLYSEKHAQGYPTKFKWAFEGQKENPNQHRSCRGNRLFLSGQSWAVAARVNKFGRLTTN